MLRAYLPNPLRRNYSNLKGKEGHIIPLPQSNKKKEDRADVIEFMTLQPTVQ